MVVFPLIGHRLHPGFSMVMRPSNAPAVERYCVKVTSPLFESSDGGVLDEWWIGICATRIERSARRESGIILFH